MALFLPDDPKDWPQLIQGFWHAAGGDVTVALSRRFIDAGNGIEDTIGLVKIIACLVAVVLAACAGSGPTPSSNDQIRADFPPGGIADRIEVTAVDRLALRGAELVAPDGHVTPALSINVNPTPTTGFSQGAWAAPITSANYGVSSIGSNALTPNVVGAAPQSQTTLLAMVSTASIQLPDPIAYRRDWQQYRIRLRLGDPPQNRDARDCGSAAANCSASGRTRSSPLGGAAPGTPGADTSSAAGAATASAASVPGAAGSGPLAERAAHAAASWRGR